MVLFFLILAFAYRWREAVTHPPPTYDGNPCPSTPVRNREDRSPKVAVWTRHGGLMLKAVYTAAISHECIRRVP